MPTKSRKSTPYGTRPPLTAARATRPPLPSTHAHRTADGTSALPRTFLNAKGRAIVAIAAADQAAKKCRLNPENRHPTEPYPINRRARHQTSIAQHPNPPHCGWDIRPPANIPQRKREGDCPNRSGCPSGEKMPTKSRKSIPRATRPPLPSTQAHRTADGTSALPTFALPDIRPPAPSRYKFDSR